MSPTSACASVISPPFAPAVNSFCKEALAAEHPLQATEEATFRPGLDGNVGAVAHHCPGLGLDGLVWLEGGNSQGKRGLMPDLNLHVVLCTTHPAQLPH
jgi:hypothetical protein